MSLWNCVGADKSAVENEDKLKKSIMIRTAH